MAHKDIYINGEQTQYILTDKGLLFNEITGNVSKGSNKSGYLYYQLTFKGKLYNFAKHRLLAEYFIPNLENKPIVHHIDGNPLNNELSNLEWATYSENNLKVINPNEEKHHIILTDDEISSEIWKAIDDTYEASNLGRLRNINTGKITFGSINKNTGYIRWNLKGHEAQAHRIVYSLFHPGEEIKFINHIDGCKNNNRISNLENISQSLNTLKAYYDTNKRKNFYTGQFDQNHVLIKTYPSMAEAARRIGCNNTNIVRNACLSGRTAYGYYWKKLSPEEYEDALNNPNVENILGKDILQGLK